MTDKQLVQRMLGRFKEYGEFERFTALELELDLATFAEPAGTEEVAFKLVRKARASGLREKLEVAFLREASPTHEEIKRHLAKVIEEAEKRAAWYSPVSGKARGATGAAKSKRAPNPHLTPLKHYTAGAKGCEANEGPGGAGAGETFSDILQALPKVKHAAMVLGDPGAGKSTALWTLAFELAKNHGGEGARLPVLVELNRWQDDRTLEDFIAAECEEIGWAMTGLAKAGRLVLLLDGLNEVLTTDRKAKAREAGRLIERLKGQAQVFVSCRRDDYTGDLVLGIDTLTLEPLTPVQIRAAVRKWVTDEGEPAEIADRFFWQLASEKDWVVDKWRRLGLPDEGFWSEERCKAEDWYKWAETARRNYLNQPRLLMKLARNPFMLSMLYGVWEGSQSLPRNRGELFSRFVLCLLKREKLAGDDERPKPEGRKLLDGLAEVAWRMQHAGAAATGVNTVLPRTKVEPILGNELLKQALDGTILEGGPEMRFRHQLLQEYFTATGLKARLGEWDAGKLWPPARWWERTGWEESAVLLAGIHAEDCTPVIEWLMDAQPEVAAQCLEESGAETRDEPTLRQRMQAAWLPRLTVGPPEARAAVGRALGRLDLDNRRGVGVVGGVPEIDWVKVENFYMARYPVTNAQFQAFLDAEDGYRDDRWWKGMTKPQREAAPGRWKEANHPRETVSWHEAMAFCAWLTHRLKYEVRLPKEEEWERAARGRDGREYPWGNEYVAGRANIDETWEYARVGPHNLGRTSAVGIYVEGASEDGVLDLSGNVWEWCLNEYSPPENAARKGSALRVLRGGSWDNHRVSARADCRGDLRPRNRNATVGFRVVCSVPIAGR